jgi:hypothetical protein
MHVLLDTPGQSDLLRHVHQPQRDLLQTSEDRGSTLRVLLVHADGVSGALCAGDRDLPYYSMIIAVSVLLLWTLGCAFACFMAVYPREG